MRTGARAADIERTEEICPSAIKVTISPQVRDSDTQRAEHAQPGPGICSRPAARGRIRCDDAVDIAFA